MRLRRAFMSSVALALALVARRAAPAVRTFPTPVPFAHVTATAERFNASSDHVHIATSAAIRFTIPALHVTRLFCEVDVSSERSTPVQVSLLKPDGTLIATAPTSCWEDNLPSHGTRCTRTMTCAAAAAIGHATDFVLLVEAGDAGATEFGASATAFDPHE